MGVELELSPWTDRYKLCGGIGGTISDFKRRTK
jgi:hypothetical protein